MSVGAIPLRSLRRLHWLWMTVVNQRYVRVFQARAVRRRFAPDEIPAEHKLDTRRDATRSS
jgi:hypothetical protein